MSRTLPHSVRSLIVSLLCSTITACASATLVNNYQRERTGAIASDESLVVLSEYQNASGDTDRDFIECVGQSLSESGYELRVIQHRDFIDGMYPYFEASTAPTSIQAVSRLAQDPAAQLRMSEMNVRYLVWVDGDTATVDSSGSLSCAVGPGGGGCFGWTRWTKQGAYKARIWDLKQGIEASSFDVDSTGTSHLIGVVIPIPLLVNVENNACKALAQWIAFAVHGG